MGKRAKSRGKDTVAAQVFLRSVSGRSVRKMAQGPLPENLAAYQAPETAFTAAHRFLERVGFKVFRDEMGLGLSIEGSPAQFAKIFGVDASQVTKVPATETIRLRPPPEIQELVEEIVVMPKPEFF